MIKLGNKVTDSITGFTGIAVARTEYLYGCVRICVEPDSLSAEGKPLEVQYFDEQRLEKTPTAKTGGPGNFPPNQDAPKRF